MIELIESPHVETSSKNQFYKKCKHNNLNEIDPVMDQMIYREKTFGQKKLLKTKGKKIKNKNRSTTNLSPYDKT